MSLTRWWSDGFVFLMAATYGDFNNPTFEPQLVLFRSGLATPGAATIATVTSLSPASMTALTLTVNGSGFGAGSTELWNGVSRATSFVSTNQQTAVIAAADLATPGTAQVSVSNGGTLSPSGLYKDIIGSPSYSRYYRNCREGVLMVCIAKPVIAVVDDDSRVRESLASLMESAGFTALVFPLANDLLTGDFLAGTSCLITDVRMPGIDGLDLQRCVRLIRPDLPVIFITAHHDDEVERCAFAEGAAFFIRKPFDAEELLRAVRIALSEASGNHGP
jgi:CheY-like chemotaxis protein